MANRIDNDWIQTKRDYKRQVGKDYFSAILGGYNDAGQPVIDEPLFPGYVHVRYPQADGQLSQSTILPFEAKMEKKFGTPVQLGYNKYNELVVIGADTIGQRVNGSNTLDNNAADPNVSYYIAQQRIITLNSHAISSSTASMLVTIQNWLWIQNGVVNYFLAGLDGVDPIDLTAYIPGSANMHGLASLFIKLDNTPEVITSTPKNIAIDLDIADIQECVTNRTAGSKPVWSWRVYNGQVGITPGNVKAGGDDFMDLRQLFNVFDTLYYQTIQDNGTPITQRSNLNFIGATIADNPGNDSTDVTVSGGGDSVAFTSTATATVANTTSETSLIGSGVGSLTLAANALTAGRTIRLRIRGVISTLGVLPGTLNIKVKLGSSIIVSTGAVALTVGLAAVLYTIEAEITCRTTGGSGTVMAQGEVDIVNALALIVEQMTNGTSTVTIDTTASQVIDVTATFSTASASNTISGTNAVVELLN